MNAVEVTLEPADIPGVDLAVTNAYIAFHKPQCWHCKVLPDRPCKEFHWRVLQPKQKSKDDPS